MATDSGCSPMNSSSCSYFSVRLSQLSPEHVVEREGGGDDAGDLGTNGAAEAVAVDADCEALDARGVHESTAVGELDVVPETAAIGRAEAAHPVVHRHLELDHRALAEVLREEVHATFAGHDARGDANAAVDDLPRVGEEGSGFVGHDAFLSSA